ncbi:MAG: CRISPR-associated endonuclease Cas3'' [Paludisphaera borealis]|uniref:CRISPR-associated endonuclease Cas3'' n=1 Tax=Paludisphaera borealis TaxID=1387353 RepID=UPI00284A6D0F|nr:CRISPR-associated endonuclease Cas3'' [Paludisphaera borealis]MDR3618729.1 CRISPR-associated endonuclease Cas3'' [Paludisphaera borealis]
MPEEFWGHSCNGQGAGVPESLRDHSTRTANRAAEFAERLGIASLAKAAGMLHDLGKYADQMQLRLKGAPESGRDHWSVGTYVALKAYAKRKEEAVAIATAIEGHHAGLSDLRPHGDHLGDLAKAFAADPGRFTDVAWESLYDRYIADGLVLPNLKSRETMRDDAGHASRMLDVRMLFSCLVDADFLETEGHFNGDAATPRVERPAAPAMDFARALKLVEYEAEKLQASNQAATGLQEARRRLFTSCLQAGHDQPPGLFTLEAPTGTGKTLALLAFALAHAVAHGLDRVIVVLPFLNILDQTVATYRRVLCGEGGFDERCVLEDHSLADWTDRRRDKDDKDKPPCSDAAKPDDPEQLRRLLSENWDAPIVLTTSVKCLESLHGDRPSACRKLHRTAKSVIVFDEVQSIPTNLVVPTLATLSRLSHRFGSSIVFATATQPAFTHLDDKIKTLCSAGWSPRPMIDFANDLFQQTANRTRVEWRITEPTRWKDLANQLAGGKNRQVLCIVNLKRHAATLLADMNKQTNTGLFHLSTQMCPRHRADVLAEVNRRLDDKEKLTVRLIATQCVEAGVDLSFPRVYRSMGPLEAIAQAAGRCNRHGDMPDAGEVIVFHPEDDGKTLYPPGGYKHAAKKTMTFLENLRAMHGGLDGPPIINDPQQIAAYYRLLYQLLGDYITDQDLKDAIEERSFGKVAKEYRLIDKRQINILVPYCTKTFNDLVARIDPDRRDRKPPGFYRKWIRDARPLTVGVYPEQLTAALQSHLCPVFFGRPDNRLYEEADWFYCLNNDLYDGELLGLKMDVEFKMCF